MRALALLLALLPAAALAQTSGVSYPPSVTPDQLAAITSTMCVPGAVVPPPEIVGGAAGSGQQCRLANSVQPRITRTVPFTTGSAGTAVVAWADMGAVPLVFPVPNIANGATQAPSCYPVAGTITSTSATVKCFTTQSVTVNLLGAVVAPIITAGAGVVGQVLAIPAS